ncbi:MAG TPA: beta-ketoacyl synthase N-terminal-like domain-containing protein [Verrucomicrobiae bacterium]|nr:beta-ketoacyl synthase N-terminal-like domain-containing protein [Verrucomicrobiae bacterium]
MRTRIVITGIGMVTPLGQNPPEILRAIESGRSAIAPPTRFDVTPFACPVCAEIRNFQPQPYVAEGKMIRLMNREAQLAVAAAHLALGDAGVKSGEAYAPDEIALFGAIGLAGLPLAEIIPLVKASSGPDGRFDPGRFGQAGLRAVSPILSFKILSNMPLCFVSICENIRGPNGIYTPWEGQGAQAVETAIRALESGEAGCALAGGCDVKTHELAFLSLEQQGLFASWQEDHVGMAPGEGAVFLVLETAERAIARGARMYARVSGLSLRTHPSGARRAETFEEVFKGLNLPPEPLSALVAADNGDVSSGKDEQQALSSGKITAPTVIHPKKQAGDLFAAAAGLQIGLAALQVARRGGRVLANCFGHGSEQAALVLESP